MRLTTLVDLAAQYSVKLPRAILDDDPLRLPADKRGWFRFQRLYDSARACVRSEADMRRIVDEAALDDAAEGSGRLEIQVDPTSYAPFTGGITPALEIVLDQAKLSSAAHGISVGVIVASSRMRHPLEARTLARLAARYAGEGDGEVVGFGLSNDERRGTTAEFGHAFDIARQAGLASVPHGGELLGPGHLHEVTQYLQPTRIGHGVRATEEPKLLEALAQRGVALEINPGSNVCLGVYPDAPSVPLSLLYESGVPIALGADDPLLFKSRLTDQYETARHVHGFNDTQLARLAADSIEASLATPTVKQELLAGVATWLAD